MSSFDTQFEAFAEQVQQELREGVTSFPTVFDLSLRIQKLADAPDTSLAQIAGAVQAEPLLAAKVIRMANTLTLNPYRGQITSLGDAIQRIGLIGEHVRAVLVVIYQQDAGQGFQLKVLGLILIQADRAGLRAVQLGCDMHCVFALGQCNLVIPGARVGPGFVGRTIKGDMGI